MRRPLLAVPVLLLGLAGCGTGTVPAEDVAARAEASLEEDLGLDVEISCPEDLPAEVGAEMRCTLTAGDEPAEYGVTVRVTSVEDERADFDVRVDDEPTA